jgi:hypothetical protein
MGARAQLATLLLVLPACSGADGTDLGVLDASGTMATTDATTFQADDGSGSGEEAAPSPLGDASIADDASLADDSASNANDAGDAGRDGALGPGDGGDGGFSFCSTICTGCCDAQGRCITGDTTAICGRSGSMCTDCSMHTCSIASAACCTSKGACGCSVGALLGCN